MPRHVIKVVSALLGMFGLLVIVAGPAQAGLVTIDFENDVNGHYFNGYQSPDSPDIVFSSTESRSTDARDYLTVDHFAPASFGKGLAISSGNPALEAGLVMTFLHATDFLSFAFGNDDPDQANTGLSQVVLTLFFGGSEVGKTAVTPNSNGIMDQTISFTGAFFDRAEFFFIDDFGYPARVNPVVDNVSYQNHDHWYTVPAPGGLLILALGLIGLAVSRRGRA